MENHTYVHAYFSNNDRTVVESHWKNSDDKIVTNHIDATNHKSTAMKLLLRNVSIDKLHENTYKHIKAMNEGFKNKTVEIAKERGLIIDVNDIQTHGYKIATRVLFEKFDPEKDKEKLFLYKLELFEIPKIRDSKKTSMKAKLRKATTMLEATKIAIQMVSG